MPQHKYGLARYIYIVEAGICYNLLNPTTTEEKEIQHFPARKIN